MADSALAIVQEKSISPGKGVFAEDLDGDESEDLFWIDQDDQVFMVRKKSEVILVIL